MEDEEREDRGNPNQAESDEALVLLARTGDRHAFAELWQRHSRSGLRVARQFTSSIDADDLVSEAYARIYQRVLAGGGPDGAFRPYLYATIRNLACRWGGDRRDVNVDDMGEFEDPEVASDPSAAALDRTLTARAFRALPERWQSVLWYTEVEGMDPHEVAPILGLTANGVAALSYRAREGLRKAWLQAHVSDAGSSSACQWSIARLGDYARNGLTARERARVSDHLAACARCGIISEEVDEVGSRLALILFPLLLGGVAGGGILASLSAPTSAAASLAPGLSPAFGATSFAVAAPTVAVGLSASAIAAPIIGTLVIVMAVSGGLAASSAPPASRSIIRPTTETTAPTNAASNTGGAPTGRIISVAGTLGSAVNGTVASVGTAVDGLVKESLVTDPANPVRAVIPDVVIGSGAGVAVSAPTGPALAQPVTGSLGVAVGVLPTGPSDIPGVPLGQ